MPKRSGGSGLPTSPDNPSRMPVPPAEPAGPLNLTRTLPQEPVSIAAKRVNAGYDESVKNGDTKYTHNCQRCLWATELRARGYDVEAMPNNGDSAGRAYVTGANGESEPNPNGYLSMGVPPIELVAVKAGYNSDSYRDWGKNVSGKAIVDTIKANFPDGSRGVIRMQTDRHGHVINWEYRNGKVTVVDGQSAGSQLYTTIEKASDITKRGFKAVWVGRMDNLEINPDLVGRFVRPRAENRKAKTY